WAAVENALVEIDPAFPFDRFECRGTHCARARAGIETDKDEAGDMAPRPPIRQPTPLPLSETPCGPQELGWERVHQRCRPTGLSGNTTLTIFSQCPSSRW